MRRSEEEVRGGDKVEVKDILSLRPKTNPSADHFQYHDTGSDRMRFGDETRSRKEGEVCLGEKMKER